MTLYQSFFPIKYCMLGKRTTPGICISPQTISHLCFTFPRFTFSRLTFFGITFLRFTYGEMWNGEMRYEEILLEENLFRGKYFCGNMTRGNVNRQNVFSGKCVSWANAFSGKCYAEKYKFEEMCPICMLFLIFIKYLYIKFRILTVKLKSYACTQNIVIT
jgi:hypothetical protein